MPDPKLNGAGGKKPPKINKKTVDWVKKFNEKSLQNIKLKKTFPGLKLKGNPEIQEGVKLHKKTSFKDTNVSKKISKIKAEMKDYKNWDKSRNLKAKNLSSKVVKVKNVAKPISKLGVVSRVLGRLSGPLTIAWGANELRKIIRDNPDAPMKQLKKRAKTNPNFGRKI